MDHDVTDWTIFGGLQVFYDTCSADWNKKNEKTVIFIALTQNTKLGKYIYKAANTGSA